MKLLRSITLFTLTVCLLLGITSCDKFGGLNGKLSSEQQTQVDQRIHDYLLAHPEILIQMSQKLQQQQMQQQAQQAKGVILQNVQTLFEDVNSPVVGNKNGQVTVVEFFDYQCTYCAKMYPLVKNVMATNSNVKVVFKEFPIFGAASQYAAMAALAAAKQGKYLEMHNALFDSGYIEGKMTPAKVNAIARKVGLNVIKLKKDMQSVGIRNELQNNFKLAQKLGLQGTPAFIVAPSMVTTANQDKITFVPGVTSQADLEKAINTAK